MTIVALVELAESRGYLDLGYRSVQEFARKEGGWSRRQVSYLLSAGRRLKELGRVDAALQDGSLCWSKVRLVVAVATAATEEEWVQKAMTAAGCSCEPATPARSAATPWPSRCTTESNTTLAARGTQGTLP
jgi:hypothetical protein